MIVEPKSDISSQTACPTGNHCPGLWHQTRHPLGWKQTGRPPYIHLCWHQGRVTGFVGGSLTSYTSFFAHVDEVRDILVHDRGVISLGSKNVRVTHRRGLQRWDIKFVSQRGGLILTVGAMGLRIYSLWPIPGRVMLKLLLRGDRRAFYYSTLIEGQ